MLDSLPSRHRLCRPWPSTPWNRREMRQRSIAGRTGGNRRSGVSYWIPRPQEQTATADVGSGSLSWLSSTATASTNDVLTRGSSGYTRATPNASHKTTARSPSWSRFRVAKTRRTMYLSWSRAGCKIRRKGPGYSCSTTRTMMWCCLCLRRQHRRPRRTDGLVS